MEQDAQTLERALAALHQQFGGRLEGPMDRTQAEMRRALSQQLGVDDLQADRIVKKLTEVGRLRYGGAGMEAETAIPAPAAPALLVPGVNLGQGAGPLVAPAPTVSAAAAIPAVGGVVAPANVGETAAENRAGAMLGQPADTDVAAPTTPQEAELAGALGDDSAGYWQMG